MKSCLIINENKPRKEVIPMEHEEELQEQERLPNQWGPSDPRVKDCLELAQEITDLLDCSQSDLSLDNQECEKHRKPLELAEAMKEAASKIELLTEKEKLPEEE